MANTELILGFPVSNETCDECVTRIVNFLRKGDHRRYFVCANPHSLIVAMSDGLFKRAIKVADLVVPDGIGVVLASRILGGKITHRITGSDIFLRLSEKLNKESEATYFFLGSTHETLMKIRERMKADFPKIRVCGVFSPPFKPEFDNDDEDLMVEEVNRVKPDVLWVGMTAPKQEKWIYRNRNRLDTKFIGAIGAAFDFYAGTVNRPQQWFQRNGLEWLSRLLNQPRHLWRRSLISAPVFLIYTIMERFTSGKKDKVT